jgi:sialate O-acetylesterase
LFQSLGEESHLKLPSIFQSNMVLQREPHFAVVHGSARPNSVVFVTLTRDDLVEALFLEVQADESGQWKVKLPPQTKGGPAKIAISSSNGGKILLENVLFGDVILCSVGLI